MRLKKGPPDLILFLTALTLLGIGLIMVFSSSAVTASVRYGDAYYFFKRQVLWSIIGIGALLITMKINYQKLKSLALPAMIIALVCLILVVTPLGIEVYSSHRCCSHCSRSLSHGAPYRVPESLEVC